MKDAEKIKRYDMIAKQVREYDKDMDYTDEDFVDTVRSIVKKR